MTKSKVYFTNFRTTLQENQLQKLARLVKTAGMLENIQFKDRYAAIKIHFGEPGNLAFLRPNYSKVLVDLIKEQGGESLSDRLQYFIRWRQEKCTGSSGYRL